MKKIIPLIAGIVLGTAIGYLIPHSPIDYNSKLLYGDSGYPKNCRAIITTNIAAYKNREYTADEIMESIDRNCGANGYSWSIE